MNKTAIITGITGQDGAYLAALLIKKGYKVIGLVRSYTHANNVGLQYLGVSKKVTLIECDLTDLSQVISIVHSHTPDEIYNLAAQSSVSLSFKQPIGTLQFNIVSVLNILEAIRLINPTCKFYQASSSEIFGEAQLPIAENSIIAPLSPYSISKATAYFITKNYREAYGLFSCSGFLFNHESYLRSDNFFIKKVIKESIAIKQGRQDILEVGNIDIKRDFGWAPKYVEAMHMILQHNTADDFVICSNTSVTLRSIIEFVFNYLGISTEKIVVSQRLFRPTEIHDIYGCNKKAKEQLGWDYDLSFFDVLKNLIDEELTNQ